MIDLKLLSEHGNLIRLKDETDLNGDFAKDENFEHIVELAKEKAGCEAPSDFKENNISSTSENEKAVEKTSSADNEETITKEQHVTTISIIGLILLMLLALLLTTRYFIRKSNETQTIINALTYQNTEIEYTEPTTLQEGSVNINNADMEKLCALPMIGKVKATAIIKYRFSNGDFTSIEDIMMVNGIGEGIFEAIRPYIIV